MTAFYIHKVWRSDSDEETPMEWTEYRVSLDGSKVPDYLDSLAGGDGEHGLSEAIKYVKEQGGEYEIVE